MKGKKNRRPDPDPGPDSILIKEGKEAFQNAKLAARGDHETLKWLYSHKKLYQGPVPPVLPINNR